MKKTLIFDFDGTIADSLELVIELFHELTGHKELLDDKRRAHLRRLPTKELIQELRVKPWRVPLLLFKGRKKMGARLGEVAVFRSMPEVLNTLHAAGHRLFIVSSNSEQNVRVFLKANHLENYFEHIYGNAGLFHKKRILTRIARSNNVELADCFYVGDETRDIFAAQHAHMAVVAVTWGYNAKSLLMAHHPTAIAEKPADLVRIFGDNKV